MITINEQRIRVEPSEQVVNVYLENTGVNVAIGDVISLTTDAITKIQKTYELGETIGGQKVVYLDGFKLYLASSDNLSCVNKIVGITSQAGNEGDFVNVTLWGELNGWGGLEETIYYLGINGQITTSKTNTGVLVQIGKGIKEDTLFVDIDNYIIRS